MSRVRIAGETTRLLGSIEEEQEDERGKRGDNQGTCVEWARTTTSCVAVIISILSFILCGFLYLQIIHVQSQLNQQQAEMQRLEDIIQNEQKGEIEDLSQRVEQEHQATLIHLAGTFVLIGGLITMFHMRNHMQHMHEPTVQRKILAILAMCPLYSLTSFLSVVFPGISEYLAIIKDCYEAYVIYTFLSFLIAVLGRGNRNVVVELLAKHADHLKPPLSCLNFLYYPDPNESKTAMANAVLLECQIFALQFVLLRPLLSISLFTLELLNGDEPLPTWDLTSPRFYLVMLQNISVFVAFTGLLRFYHAVHSYIEWIEPFPKFLCIKGVVFMTFWQGLVISILANAAATNNNNNGDDNNSSNNSLSPQESAAQIQNLLICLEMLGFSIAHYFVFPTEEWEEGYIRKRLDMSMGDSIAFGDFVSDVKMVYNSAATSRAKYKQQSRSRHQKDQSSTMGSTSTIPSEDGSTQLDEEKNEVVNLEGLDVVTNRPE